MNDRVLDIGGLLDNGPFSLIQRLAVLLAALAVVMDGFDGQLIGFAIPALLKDLHLTREAIAPVVAAGLLGMATGSFLVGGLADRYGRRLALIASVCLFGAATFGMGLVGHIWELAALRFIAGLGIGGAMPTASIIAVEFAPARVRTVAVTATVVCYPVGGILAGMFASAVLPASGWRTLFFLGGLLPIAFAVLQFFLLPESPRYMARRDNLQAALRRLMTRLHGRVEDGVRLVDLGEAASTRAGRFQDLFSPQLLRETLALSGAFFMCLLSLYSAYSWLPAMLTFEGMDIGLASHGLTAYNFGGLAGSLLCAVLVARFGSRQALAGAAVGALVSALLLQMFFARLGTEAFIAGIGIHGFFVSAVQGPMYALAAFVYPTEIRARGIGAATAFGRLGAIVSAFAGAMVISMGGGAAYFAMLAIAMLQALLFLSLIRNHIPARNTTLPAPAGLSVADKS